MARIKQFILDVAAPLRRIDEPFLRHHLDPAQLELAYRLRRAELLHSIAVARRIRDTMPAELAPGESRAVIQAALLHDIGKIRYPAGAIEKSLTLLAGQIFGIQTAWLRGWKAWDIRQNHPEYGWEIIRDMADFKAYPYLTEAVRCHHRPADFRSNSEKERGIFELLRQADDLN